MKHYLCFYHDNDGEERGFFRSEYPPEPERCQACRTDVEKRMIRYDVKVNWSLGGSCIKVSVEGPKLDVERWSEGFVQLHCLYNAAILSMGDNGSGKIHRAELRRDLEKGGR